MALIDILLKETTTIGVRFHEVSRAELDREIKKVGTEFGELRVKMSKITCGEVKFTPEYEDCKKISRKTGMPLIEVMKKVQRQAR
jgi:hypothetical protein